jgi:hypothetical protein
LNIITKDITVCIGQEAIVQVDAFGGTSPYTYHWFNPINEFHTGSQYSFFPEENTTFFVYAEDVNGCKSLTKPLKVNLHPPLFAEITLNKTTICPGDSIMVFIDAEGGNGGPYFAHYKMVELLPLLFGLFQKEMTR